MTTCKLCGRRLSVAFCSPDALGKVHEILVHKHNGAMPCRVWETWDPNTNNAIPVD